METKTLNQWLKALGYRWVDGQEQLFKGELTRSEAQGIIANLQLQGAVTRG
jgi:hypothetical protein